MKNIFLLLFASCIALGIFTRFVGLTSFPPSLYWEESALGYDAYSILKTGKDFHGHFLPIVAFESFGDFKPSFYFYALVPSIAVFGLTDFAVRFPSALSGVLLIVGVGLIARELGKSIQRKELKYNQNLPAIFQLLAMFIVAINPWAIEFSRGGWEVNLATMLLTFGLWLELLVRNYLLDLNTKLTKISCYLCLAVSILLLALSMYTYHSTKVIAPILLLGIWVDITLELWLRTKTHLKRVIVLVVAGIFFSILISPVLLSLNKSETQQRFAETSLFADGRQVKLSNQLIAQSKPQWLGKILYHRYVISSEMILQNYLTHFNFSFLFLSGDSNPRHSTQFVGLMYTGEALFLVAGVYFLIKEKNPLIYFLFFWLFVGVIPAALTTATPHALRILPSMPAWLLIITAGAFQVGIALVCCFESIGILIFGKKKRVLTQKLTFISVIACFAIFYGWQFLAYWRFYSLVYPKLYASEWQYGYKQMIGTLQKEESKYPDLPVQVTREYGRPSTYYWFYTKADPRTVQEEEHTAKKDQGEFLQYKNVSFVDQVQFGQKSLVASTEESFRDFQSKHLQTQMLDEIKDPLNKVVWVIYLAQ